MIRLTCGNDSVLVELREGNGENFFLDIPFHRMSVLDSGELRFREKTTFRELAKRFGARCGWLTSCALGRELIGLITTTDKSSTGNLLSGALEDYRILAYSDLACL